MGKIEYFVIGLLSQLNTITTFAATLLMKMWKWKEKKRKNKFILKCANKAKIRRKRAKTMAQSHCINSPTTLAGKLSLRANSPSVSPRLLKTFISSKFNSRKFCSMVISASSSPSTVSGGPLKSLLLDSSERKNELMDAIKSSQSNCLSETHLDSAVPGLHSKTRGKVQFFCLFSHWILWFSFFCLKMSFFLNFMVLSWVAKCFVTLVLQFYFMKFLVLEVG